VRDRQSSRESLSRRDSRTELEAYREDRPPSSGDLPPTSLKLDDARQAALEQVEREHILRVLKIVGGSRTRAADMLGVSRSTLWEKVKRYGIE
jgi:transcriptional regulator of acetoin/glycerol metabolism